MGKDKKIPPYEATEKVPLSDEDKKKAGRHFYRSGKNQDEQQSGNAVIDNMPPSGISINEGAETSTELELKERTQVLAEGEEKQGSQTEGFNQAALMERLDRLESNLKTEVITETTALVLKILADQQGVKSGRKLKDNYPEGTSNLISVSLQLSPELANLVNKKVNLLKDNGLVKNRDTYLANIIKKDLENS